MTHFPVGSGNAVEGLQTSAVAWLKACHATGVARQVISAQSNLRRIPPGGPSWERRLRGDVNSPPGFRFELD